MLFVITNNQTDVRIRKTKTAERNLFWKISQMCFPLLQVVVLYKRGPTNPMFVFVLL